VREYSAGGLVVDGIESDTPMAIIIGHTDRKGAMLWALPKGHIEVGERPEETAIREIAEETGVSGEALTALGCIDYWFRAQERIVHKTVHHFLVAFRAGELSAGDHEVGQVAWVPLDRLSSWLTHADERRLAATAQQLVDTVRTRGRSALPPLPPSSPRRRPQTHSVARHHDRPDTSTPPTTPADPLDERRGDDDHR
jgi:8-oxo-dGTP pyrophosphatase MutT (NUDIX family)